MPTNTPLVTRDLEADIACAIAELPFVEAVYVLDPRGPAEGHPDAFALAVVLAPYDVRHLVQAHYAILLATDSHEVSGRVLYVNGAIPAPMPVRHARQLSVAPADRIAARARIAERRAANAVDDVRSKTAGTSRAELEVAFQELLESRPFATGAGRRTSRPATPTGSKRHSSITTAASCRRSSIAPSRGWRSRRPFVEASSRSFPIPSLRPRSASS